MGMLVPENKMVSHTRVRVSRSASVSKRRQILVADLQACLSWVI